MRMIFLMCLLISACSFAKGRDLPTVNFVDINRYIGKWYTISSMPQFFTRGCVGQTADYEIINEQMIKVLNTCLKKKGVKTISGQAVVTNAATNAELEVTFNSFFTRLFRVRGDYYILKLDENYQYVLVGSRNRKSLWILARTTEMPKEIYESYVQKANELGFPVETLEFSHY